MKKLFATIEWGLSVYAYLHIKKPSCRSHHRLMTKEWLEFSAPKWVACCPAYNTILLPQRSEGNTSVSDPPYARQSWQSTVVSCPNCSYIPIDPDDCIGNEFCGNDMFQT